MEVNDFSPLALHLIADEYPPMSDAPEKSPEDSELAEQDLATVAGGVKKDPDSPSPGRKSAEGGTLAPFDPTARNSKPRHYLD